MTDAEELKEHELNMLRVRAMADLLREKRKQREQAICNDCGAACCKCVTIKVGAMSADESLWANMRGTVSGGLWRLPAKCVQLGGDNRCMIYETRPDVCREYAVGGPMCEDARAALTREFYGAPVRGADPQNERTDNGKGQATA